jgi:hypothetical protein
MLQNALDEAGINWLIVGGYDHRKSIVRRLNGSMVLKDGKPKKLLRCFKASVKSDLLHFKDLECPEETPIEPTTLGTLHRWVGDEGVDGEVNILEVTEVEVPNDTPDETVLSKAVKKQLSS